MTRYTIFNTPVIRNIFRGISLLLLKISGWKKVGRLPDEEKYVIIVAPHTSNWDLFFGILLAFAFRLNARFIAKNQLFRPPFAGLMKWLGGLPVDRASAHHTIDQMVRMFDENKTFVLALAPEGTRHKTEGWRSGFYHIAKGARVPVLLAFIDYRSKSGGAGPLFRPTGDIQNDMKSIADFYATVRGRRPDQTGPVRILAKL